MELRGDAGVTAFLDDGDDSHGHLGASLRACMTSRLSFQPEFQYLWKGGGHKDIGVVANLAYDFRSPGPRVVPYVVIGPGILNTRQNRFSSTNFYISGGAGVKIFVNERWYVAPEFRVGWEPHARFTVGVGYVWKR